MSEVEVHLTDEQLQAIERGEPIRGNEMIHQAKLVVLSEAAFERIRTYLSPIMDGDGDVSAAYPLMDEAMKEDWDDPKMAEYDDYEARKQ